MANQAVKGLLWVLLCCLVLAGCGGGGSDGEVIESNNSSSTDTSQSDNSNSGETDATDDIDNTINNAVVAADAAFPGNVAVASPTSVSPQSLALQATAVQWVQPSALSDEVVDDYSVTTQTIEALLEGLVDVNDEVDMSLLFEFNDDASCYGPSIAFNNHPDAPADAGESVRNGELPTGDLGLWSETEGEGDEACAAAQMNERMRGVSARHRMAMMTLAGLVVAYESEGEQNWPDDFEAGDSSDLTQAMNDLLITGTEFSEASISRSADGNQWTYSMAFTYQLLGVGHDVVLNLVHAPADTDDAYEGLLTLRINDEFEGGNCETEQVTLNASLHYIQAASDDVVLQYREGMFCGHNIDAAQAPVTSDALSGNAIAISPTETFSETWGNNFIVFTADLDPSTMAGRFSYAWQAGYNDSHARILNLGLASGTSGEAYFGFGNRLQTENFDGGVKGFICNWAGPGNDHSLQPYVQRQHITLNTSTGVFTPTNHGEDNDSSSIVYAPTNSCLYDQTDEGGFVFGEVFEYDRNMDLFLDDNDLVDVVETVTDAEQQLAFGLQGIPGSSSATTIWQYINEERGFTLPAYPE